MKKDLIAKKIATIFPMLFLSVFCIALFSSLAIANSHYSFESSEQLKSQIHWRDYNSDAFEEARKENKPIFLLLTAPSWCYYCQVYESEDYLFNPQIVKILNEKFIPIYVDADQRQDLTRQYLEGGWPSTTVMTPAKQRLFGFSGPRPVQNMIDNLQRAEVYVQSNPYSSNFSYQYEKINIIIPTQENLELIVERYRASLLQLYDPVYGGFGTGQKFPQARTEGFALEEYLRTNDSQFLDIVQNTLRHEYTNISEIETNYHLFDPVEGGFHRYGTQRTWSPPHYEKMLYDNARLLKTYSTLSKITPEDLLVQEVVQKTDQYIQNTWYDAEEGGFYGNTDVHGEETYYGKNPRPSEKPRVEKTKYTDWNAEAILTYLYLWNVTGNETYRMMTTQSLDFYKQSMVTDRGALHYMKEDGTRGVSGNLLDNAYLMLAFTEGYEYTHNESYLHSAKQLADYTIEKLYDWNSGGFFERHSTERKLYAPGENIILTKPVEENGIMAYTLLNLYSLTGEPLYLSAGLKTLGNQLGEQSSLDNGYYLTKSAQFALQKDLLGDWARLKGSVQETEKKNQASFWLTPLLANSTYEPFSISDEGATQLNGSFIILFLIAFIGGFISFISPCTLPILPAYLGLSFRTSKQNIKMLSLFFFLGLILVFMLLGVSATLVGNFLRSHLTLFSQFAGIGIIMFGLFLLLGKSIKGLHIRPPPPTGYIGAFLFGTALGISWTPCIGPILLAVLLLASTTGSAILGGLLLFAYGLGLSLPLILVAIFLEKIDKESAVWRFLRGKELKFRLENPNKTFSIHTTSLFSGILFIILGYLIFSGSLISLNKYAYTTAFQGAIRQIEEWLLRFVS